MTRLYDGLSSSMEIAERQGEYDRYCGYVKAPIDEDAAYELQRNEFCVVRLIDKIREGSK